MSDVCKTCGIVAGTHACNPLDINMKNMRLTIQNQQSEITRLNAIIADMQCDTERIKYISMNCELIKSNGTKGKEAKNLRYLREVIDQAMSEKGDK